MRNRTEFSRKTLKRGRSEAKRSEANNCLSIKNVNLLVNPLSRKRLTIEVSALDERMGLSIHTPLKSVIIHLKYFPNSDWLKAHA